MQPHELTPLLEALLFASDQPLTVSNLVKAVGERGVGAPEVKKALEAMAETYDFQNRGFRLVRLGNGYQVVTRERYAPWIEGMMAGRRRSRLSRAALETAAVIAYKQPLTRLDIERIRGVDAGGVLSTLLERNLIMIKGRDPGPGRPLLYGTTQGFLDYFGLGKLTDLPHLDEIAALAREETASIWDDSELARFEKHGVEGEAVPTPYEDPDPGGEPGEDESPDAGPEADSRPAGEEPALAPPPSDEDLAADRAEFRDVVTSLTEEAPLPGGDDPPPEDGPPREAGDSAAPGEEDTEADRPSV